MTNVEAKPTGDLLPPVLKMSPLRRRLSMAVPVLLLPTREVVAVRGVADVHTVRLVPDHDSRRPFSVDGSAMRDEAAVPARRVDRPP